MKTRYKFIHFVDTGVPAAGKTSVWSCRNNGNSNELGIIIWYPTWREYCYEDTTPAVYSAGCLADIQDFIDQLMKARAA